MHVLTDAIKVLWASLLFRPNGDCCFACLWLFYSPLSFLALSSSRNKSRSGVCCRWRRCCCCSEGRGCASGPYQPIRARVTPWSRSEGLPPLFRTASAARPHAGGCCGGVGAVAAAACGLESRGGRGGGCEARLKRVGFI